MALLKRVETDRHGDIVFELGRDTGGDCSVFFILGSDWADRLLKMWWYRDAPKPVTTLSTLTNQTIQDASYKQRRSWALDIEFAATMMREAEWATRGTTRGKPDKSS